MSKSVTGSEHGPENIRRDNAYSLQGPQDAYTLLHAEIVRPLINESSWGDNVTTPGFHERIIVPSYKFPQGPESVPRFVPKSALPDAKSTALTFNNQTKLSMVKSETPPSLGWYSSAESEPSIQSTEAKSAVMPGHFDEEGYIIGEQGLAVQAPYGIKCLFDFLGCEKAFLNAMAWYDHSKSHFQGKPPPKHLLCPVEGCQWQTTCDSGEVAWEERGKHLGREHNLLAERRRGWVQRDKDLYQHLFNMRLIERIQLQELRQHGRLGVDKEAFVLTEGEIRHRRRQGGRPKPGAQYPPRNF